MLITEQILTQRGFASEEQIAKWKLDAKRSSTTLEHMILVDAKVMTEDVLYQSISEALGYLLIKTHFGISLDETTSGKFKPQEMEKLRFIPIIASKSSYVVVDNPENKDLESRVVRALGPDMSWAICRPEIFDKLYQKLVTPLELNSMTTVDSQIGTTPDDSVQDLKKTGNQIPDTITLIIKSALDARASDIQFLPSENKLEVFFKIDGVKQFFKELPKNINDNIARVIAKDANMVDQTITKPASGMSQRSIGNTTISLRVSMLRTRSGVDIDMRILDNTLPELNNLGISASNLTMLRKFYRMSKGLVLLTGPTGSGKSTTLYSALNDRGVEDRTVLSVEDPIEYVVPGASQIEVNVAQGNTFDSSIKAFLRHAPDVIIVGEMRDKPVALEAFRAAATGHLVLSTLHTNDAVSAITRLLDIGIPVYSISESLAVVVAQRLVRRVCKHCAEDYTVTSTDTDYTMRGFAVGTVVKHAKGCEHCRNIGYYGRTAINEIVVLDTKIRDMLDSGSGPTAIRSYVRNELKIPTLLDDALFKVRQGVTTLEEIAFMFDEIV